MSGWVIIAVNLIRFRFRELDQSRVLLIRLEQKWVSFSLNIDSLRLILLKVRLISFTGGTHDSSMEGLLIDSPRVTNLNSR